MLPLWDEQRAKRYPFWVALVIAVNIYVFYLEVTSSNPDAFITRYALIPADISLMNPQTWQTFLSSQFLHGGFLHIFSNMWFLWVFGGTVEARVGRVAFPLLYLTGGTIGNVLQYFIAPASPLAIIGASGAVATVLGTYYALFPHHKIKTLLIVIIFITVIDLPASLMLLYWFVIQLFSGAAAIAPINAASGGIAYFAHIGGFITGLLVGKYVVPRMT